MFDIVIRRQDNLPTIQKRFYSGGQPIDLTNFDVVFVVLDMDGNELIRNPATKVAGGDNNTAAYKWTDQDSAAVARDTAFAFFQATDGVNTLTVPNNRPLSLLLTDNDSFEFSYSGDPMNRPLDRVRFLLQDTDTSKALFTDSEINALLSIHSDPFEAAAEGADMQEAKYTRYPNKTVGPLTIDYRSMASAWGDLAASIRKRKKKQNSGARAIMTQTRRPPHFELGIHDIKEPTPEDELLGEQPL